MNVAFHAQNLGLNAKMISRVGMDQLGEDLMAFLQKKKVDTRLVQKDLKCPTGVVNVALDAHGSPSYEIVQEVAWDHIQVTPDDEKAVQAADAFVFGSLAARTELVKKTLLHLLGKAKLKVFDVNLRPPFVDRQLIQQLLNEADMVKMNDEELAIISDWYSSNKHELAQAEDLFKVLNLKTIIVTKGAKGAFAINDGQVFESNGIPIQVEDTIGSGDAFLASFLSKFLNEIPTSECLNFACKVGALVATKKGGTPTFSFEDISKI